MTSKLDLVLESWQFPFQPPRFQMANLVRGPAMEIQSGFMAHLEPRENSSGKHNSREYIYITLVAYYKTTALPLYRGYVLNRRMTELQLLKLFRYIYKWYQFLAQPNFWHRPRSVWRLSSTYQLVEPLLCRIPAPKTPTEERRGDFQCRLLGVTVTLLVINRF
jgi:hypothetical protein